MRRLLGLAAVTMTALAITLVGSTPAVAVKQDKYFNQAVQWINGAKAAGLATFPAVAQACPNGVTVAPTSTSAGWIAHASNSGGPVAQISCKILYNFYVSKSKPLPVPSDYKTFCSVTVHEYGHLIGLSHSSDPRSFMHDPVTVVPPACGTPAPTRFEYLKPKS